MAPMPKTTRTTAFCRNHVLHCPIACAGTTNASISLTPLRYHGHVQHIGIHPLHHRVSTFSSVEMHTTSTAVYIIAVSDQGSNGDADNSTTERRREVFLTSREITPLASPLVAG